MSTTMNMVTNIMITTGITITTTATR
jgi:hypothetical protein